MNNRIIDFYLQFSQFTNPGLYKDALLKTLPDKIEDIGFLVRKNIIHRVTLKRGNIGSNADFRYGDMTKVPWFRQPEDDNFPTVLSILGELYRRDAKGLTLERKTEDKMILTCRFVAILTASLLKIKGIPARVRSGFAPYFNVSSFFGKKSVDHWITQYWSKEKNRWVTVDVDGSIEGYLKFNPYDIPKDVFDFSADAWFNVRSGKIPEEYFYNAGGFSGLVTVAWELFYDFHSLMNNEIIYFHHPEIAMLSNFKQITEKELIKIDDLASLMQDPDQNFDKLREIWETNKEFRLLKGGLL